MTLTDASKPTQASNIITAASGSSAKGLGVQIARNGTVLALGPDSNLPGNTNQIQIGSGLSGIVSIPLSANYIRTGTATGNPASQRHLYHVLSINELVEDELKY
jgi:type 1 fimbria pilin